MLEEAAEKRRRISSVYPGLQAIRNALRAPAALNKHIENIFRSEGIVSVSVALTEVEREASGGKQRFRSAPIGRIQGVLAVRDFAKAAVEIERLINDLTAIQRLDPKSASRREIAQGVKINNSVSSQLAAAQEFIEQVSLFLTPQNHDELMKLSSLDGLRQADISPALRRFSFAYAARLCSFSHCRKASFIRDCHPGPPALNASTISWS